MIVPSDQDRILLSTMIGDQELTFEVAAQAVAAARAQGQAAAIAQAPPAFVGYQWYAGLNRNPPALKGPGIVSFTCAKVNAAAWATWLMGRVWK